MNKFTTYFGQIITDTELNEILGELTGGIERFVQDFGYAGIAAGAAVTQHTPNNLTVDVGGPAIVYDQLAQRMSFGSAQVVNCALDENGASTAVAGGSNEKYLSIFIKFVGTPSDPRTDDLGATVYFRTVASFQLRVAQGAEAPLGTATRVALRGDQILLADVKLVNAQTAIVNANVSTTRTQTIYDLTGSPLAIKAKGLIDVLQQVVTQFNSLSTGTAASIGALASTTSAAQVFDLATFENAIRGLDPSLTSSTFRLADGLHMKRVQTALAAGPSSVTVGFSAGKVWRAFATNGTGRIVGAGDAGLLGYSDDMGLTWTAATPAASFADDFKCAIFAEGLFIIGGGGLAGDGTIQSSPDGVTWTQRLASAAVPIYNLAHNGTTFVAQLWDGSAFSVYTSAAGTSWASASISTAFSLTPQGSVGGGGLFVKGLNSVSGTVQSSPDGLVWTARTLGSSDAFQVDYLAYHSVWGFIAAGIDAGGTNRYVQHSADGITWTRVRKEANSSLSVGGIIPTPHAVFVLSETQAKASWTVHVAAYSDTNGDFLSYNTGTRQWSTVQPGSNTWVALHGRSGIVDRCIWLD